MSSNKLITLSCEIKIDYNLAICVFDNAKNWENNGRDKIGLVTPIPGVTIMN